jgi:MFS family permease
MSIEHPHRGRTLLLSGILHAFTHLYQVALLPLYLLIQKDPLLKLQSIEQATLLVTVLMLSYFVPAYAVGVMADHLNKRKLLAWGLAVNAVGFIGLSYAPSFPMALGCMVLSGMGGSFFHPAATALIARLYPTTTGKAFGLLGIGASAGFFLGPLYTGWRAASGNWRAPILEIGIVGLLAAIAFAFLADDEPVHEHEHAQRAIVPMFPTGSLWLLFLVAAFAFSLRDFTGSSMGSLGSLFLQKAHGLSVENTGRILSTIFLASAVSNPLFGGLSDRNQTTWTMFVLLMAGVMVILFPHVPVSYSAPALMVYGFFFMASYPMVEASLMGAVPHVVRGRVFGLFITIGGILGNLAHWAMGAWVRQQGPNAANPESYFTMYLALAGLIVVSLIGLPCLKALRNRELKAGALSPKLAVEGS